jgi:hypothetical protein
MVKAVDREAEKAAKMAMRRLRAAGSGAGSGERDEQLSRRKEEKDTSQAETRNTANAR